MRHEDFNTLLSHGLEINSLNDETKLHKIKLLLTAGGAQYLNGKNFSLDELLGLKNGQLMLLQNIEVAKALYSNKLKSKTFLQLSGYEDFETLISCRVDWKIIDREASQMAFILKYGLILFLENQLFSLEELLNLSENQMCLIGKGANLYLLLSMGIIIEENFFEKYTESLCRAINEDAILRTVCSIAPLDSAIVEKRLTAIKEQLTKPLNEKQDEKSNKPNL